MKYAAAGSAVMILCITASILIIRRIAKHRPISLPFRIVLELLLSLFLVILCGLGYTAVYYHAQEEALDAMKSTDTVTMTDMERGWKFDGPGTDSAFVFYPGAKVQSEAYAPLMKILAEGGLDCYLLDPPLHIAMLDPNGIERAMADGKYESWYIGGHSLGGFAASVWASGHLDKIDGVILLGSYPAKDLHGVRMLSVYGSEDGCLNRKEYEASRRYWPEDAQEYIITGGNHAGFAHYGFQKGDGEALIPIYFQETETAWQILEFLK
ncbi:MAG: hypothetical protein IIZ10_02250 [Solobacterium sp.]|nr:hypothetical protein [Solobacterium sp.]